MKSKLKDYKWIIPEGVVTGILLTKYLLWYDERVK